MSKIIILYTHWAPDHWESPKETLYPMMNYNQLPGWNDLRNSLPLQGLGIYTAGNIRGNPVDYTNQPFVFIKVTNMRYDEQNQPHFTIEPIAISNINSAQFLATIGQHRLFEAREFEPINAILNRLGVETPQDWLDIITTPAITSWEDWIGSYYKKLNSDNISPDDFEDITANLLRALGFQIEQMGHTRQGAFPDGIIKTPNLNLAFIYDCKCSNNYYPIADDSRAMDSYMNQEGARLKERNPNLKVYPCFIARSFANKELPRV